MIVFDDMNDIGGSTQITHADSCSTAGAKTFLKKILEGGIVLLSKVGTVIES